MPTPVLVFSVETSSVGLIIPIAHRLPLFSDMVPNNFFSNKAHIQRIKDKRAAKEEKARYEKMAEKMHAKRVERLKRREKRNKLLSS
jgi:hypothetical protein